MIVKGYMGILVSPEALKYKIRKAVVIRKTILDTLEKNLRMCT